MHTLAEERGQTYDLAIVGGGVNGAGIARDAAGRGLRVILFEAGDIASGTSQASSKLFHGGLRYLEFYEFRLVREALVERERLLKIMPHIAWPMRFVAPFHKGSSSPLRWLIDALRALRFLTPGSLGLKPWWLMRLALYLYDHMGGRKILPATSRLNEDDERFDTLQQRYSIAFAYSDCWVDDARLVVLNVRDAALYGATIRARTEVIAAKRDADMWGIHIEGSNEVVRARALVNASGACVDTFAQQALELPTRYHVRLVRGSHIITKRLFDHDSGYFLQGEDGRIIFLLPYENDFTLIGTTEAAHKSLDEKPQCSEVERDYLLAFANRYLKNPISKDDVVGDFAGVRPLYDDGSKSATAATRDYILDFDHDGAPLLNVFGGKITTYRKLAESAVDQLIKNLGIDAEAWTASKPLPGGDFGFDCVEAVQSALLKRYSFIEPGYVMRLFRRYGSEIDAVLGQAKTREDLGEFFGEYLCEREVEWHIAHEFAQDIDDIIWRRTKTGLVMNPAARDRLTAWIKAHACTTR